jgi:flagellar hook-associated protein 3 FlgL
MAFRVTNSMMVQNYNRNQNTAKVRMHEFQNQLSTQKKVTRLSDDPVNVVKSLNARSRLYDVEQYKKNIEDAKAWLTQTESAMFELNELVKRGIELGVQAANDVYTDDDRSAISYEIKELRDQIGTLANTTLGDKYIFGGYNVSYPPFTFDLGPDDGSRYTLGADNWVEVDNTGVLFYNYPDGSDWRVDVSEMLDFDDEALQRIAYSLNIGQEFDIGIHGLDFLGFGEHEDGFDIGKSKNVYLIFNDFFNVINSMSELNSVENADGEMLHKNIQPFIRRLQEFQKQNLAQMAEVGGRISRLDLMMDRYGKDEINYTQMKSDVEDLDLAEAIMWFSMSEAVYRASLGVGGRILQPTLIDFLR